MLQRAFDRYANVLFKDCNTSDTDTHTTAAAAVTGVDVYVADVTAQLQLGVSEVYNLSIPDCSQTWAACRGTINANTVYGVIRALESLSQLVQGGCGTILHSPVNIVNDAPRFQWRGLMVDTARHFLPIAKLERVIDAMSWTKMNTLHVHLTDAQSFPFASGSLPSLAQHGSFKPKDECSSPFNPLEGEPGARRKAPPTCTYTVEELQQLVSYGNDRAVRIVPEMDTPAHSASFCGAISGHLRAVHFEQDSLRQA